MSYNISYELALAEGTNMFFEVNTVYHDAVIQFNCTNQDLQS